MSEKLFYLCYRIWSSRCDVNEAGVYLCPFRGGGSCHLAWFRSSAELAQAAPGLERRAPTFQSRFLDSPFPAVALLSPLPGWSPAPVSPPWRPGLLLQVCADTGLQLLGAQPQSPGARRGGLVLAFASCWRLAKLVVGKFFRSQRSRWQVHTRIVSCCCMTS